MSTRVERPITHPRDIDLPSNRDLWDAGVARLNSEERWKLLRDLLDAQWAAHALGDYQPVATVIAEWHATFLVESQPGFAERQKEIDRLLPTAPRLTRQDIERNLAPHECDAEPA